MYIGFPEKAYYYWKEALNLDGDSSSYFIHLWNNEWIHGNYEKAVEYGNKVCAIDSTTARLNMDLAISHIYLGNFEKSLKYLNKHLDSLKAHGQIEIIDPSYIGYIFWKNGFKEKAEYYFDETIKNCNKMIDLGREYTLLPDVYYDMASIYAFRGKKDKAFKYLKNFSQSECGELRSGILLKNDPLFSSIRNEPEFRKIQKVVETKYRLVYKDVRKWLEERGRTLKMVER